MAVRVGTIHPCIMLVLWNLSHFSFLSVTDLPPPPEMMLLHSNFCSVKSNFWTKSEASSSNPEQSSKFNPATSLPCKKFSSQAGGTPSKSFPLLTKLKIKKRKKLLTRGEEHVLDETYNLLWRNLKNILLKTNPIKLEPLADVAKKHVAQ